MLGDYEGKTVTVAIGRFGPYVRHDGKFVSIPKDVAPAGLSLDEAIGLIEDKRRKEAQRIVKVFDEEPLMQILNGRFGVYIAYDGKNYRLPRSIEDPASLTLEQAMEIVKSQADKPAKPRRKAKN